MDENKNCGCFKISCLCFTSTYYLKHEVKTGENLPISAPDPTTAKDGHNVIVHYYYYYYYCFKID